MDFSPVFENFPRLLQGFVLTIELTLGALVVGMGLAIPLALLRISRRRLLWMPVYGYIFFLRGTPLLIQIFLIYYGVGQIDWIKDTFLWPIFREAHWCALIAFGLNTSAYDAEILRGSIQAVPHGEVEAARALGMSRSLTFRRIVLPHAIRLMLPAYSNDVVITLQATSLASIITLMDLTGVAEVLVAQYFMPYQFYLTIGAIYLVTTYVIVWIFRRVEHRLMGHRRERPSGRRAKAALPVR
jgi:His/Glu/Gln/Arg/opine family amino acid ABC transporter permease subunit